MATLASLRDLFSAAGFDVETATTGRDALGVLLDGENPSAIVLDARMPVMTGEELVTVLRAYRRLAPIPVLVLTAAEIRDGFARHVELVMRKPFRADELVASVEALVSGAASVPPA